MAALVGLLALAGCASDNAVGNEDLINFNEKAQERLGQQSPSSSAQAKPKDPDAAARQPTALATQAARTAAPVRPRPTQAAAKPFVIAINSDNASATQFNPSAVRVFVGQPIEWVNKDTVNRSVEADAGAFKSPSIPPGGTFSYVANTVGKFNYHDGTRPYAVASLEVLKR